MKELHTWHKHGCFSRKSRKGAQNIIDTKWVHKHKEQLVTRNATDAAKTSGSKSEWIIRSRLTVRGFKDRDKGYVETHAGTSSKTSQTLIVSEAVKRRWKLCTTDISAAFLQGVTYEELSQLTGAEVREVNFEIAPDQLRLFRQLPGFSDFNPKEEVIHLEKPGIGLIDAPEPSV